MQLKPKHHLELQPTTPPLAEATYITQPGETLLLQVDCHNYSIMMQQAL